MRILRCFLITAILSLAALQAPSAPFVPAVPLGEAKAGEPRLKDPSMAAPLPQREADKASATEIPLDQWNLSAPAAGGFAPIRANFDGTLIRLRPNAAQPANSFGWIEAPLAQDIAPGAGRDGDQFVLEVHYSYTDDRVGPPPNLRLRIHTENWAHYVESSVTSIAVGQGRGSGIHRAYFDRNLLGAPANLRLFIDLHSIDPSNPPIDPEYTVTISRTRFYSLEGGQPPEGNRFNAVYLEHGGHLFAHVNGDTLRTLVRNDVSRYAWDATHLYAITHDNHLYAYTADFPTLPTLVDDVGDVANIAVIGNRVVYLTTSGEIWEWEGQTASYLRLVDSGGDGVASSPDGRHFLLLDLSSANNLFQLYQYDFTSEPPSVLPLTGGHSVLDLVGRWSRHY